MVCKEILKQYSDLQEECKEVRKKIRDLEERIPKIQKRIDEIESGETVKDKVKGGNGGLQSFNIEGVPTKEYEKRKTELMTKKLLLNQRKNTLELLEFDIIQKTNDVESFISSVEDSRIRRIINLRFIECLSWNEVADRIGGGNTEDSVRKAYERFMKS